MPHIDFTNKDYFYNPLGSVKLKGEGEGGNISIPDCSLSINPLINEACGGIPDVLWSLDISNFDFLVNKTETIVENALNASGSGYIYYFHYSFPVNFSSNKLILHSKVNACSQEFDTPDNCRWTGVLESYLFHKQIEFPSTGFNQKLTTNNQLETLVVPYKNTPTNCIVGSTFGGRVEEDVILDQDPTFLDNIGDSIQIGTIGILNQPLFGNIVTNRTFVIDKYLYSPKRYGWYATFSLTLDNDGDLAYSLLIEPTFDAQYWSEGFDNNQKISNTELVDLREDISALPIGVIYNNVNPPPDDFAKFFKTTEPTNSSSSPGPLRAIYTKKVNTNHNFLAANGIDLTLDRYSGSNIIDWPFNTFLKIGV